MPSTISSSAESLNDVEMQSSSSLSSASSSLSHSSTSSSRSVEDKKEEHLFTKTAKATTFGASLIIGNLALIFKKYLDKDDVWAPPALGVTSFYFSTLYSLFKNNEMVHDIHTLVLRINDIRRTISQLITEYEVKGFNLTKEAKELSVPLVLESGFNFTIGALSTAVYSLGYEQTKDATWASIAMPFVFAFYHVTSAHYLRKFCDNLQKEYDGLVKDCFRISEKIGKKYQERIRDIRELKDDLSRKNIMIEEQKEQTQKKDSTITAQQEQIKKLEEEKTGKDKMIMEQEKQLQQKDGTINNQQKQIKGLNEEKSKMIVEQKEQTQKKDSTITAQQEQIKKLEEEKAGKDKMIIEQKTQIQQKDKEIKGLREANPISVTSMPFFHPVQTSSSPLSSSAAPTVHKQNLT